MIKGIGTDIIKISRLNERVIERILSDEEKEYYFNLVNRARKLEFAAGRFAAKESVIKAIGKFFPLKDISILNNKMGEPYVSSKSLRKILGTNDLNVLISISHEKEYAIAMVVIEDGGIYGKVEQ